MLIRLTVDNALLQLTVDNAQCRVIFSWQL